ncbi:MAG: ABC transporter substrate-binding protein [Pseudomonadota bacterium]
MAQDEKHVFMVLWRGETEVEAGFFDYFAENERAIRFTVTSLGRDRGALPAILEQIEAEDPDLVYTWGTSTTLGLAGQDPALAPDATAYPPVIMDRPIVFTMVSQPIRSHIVPGFEPTGRNLTGVSHIVPIETQLQAMQAYMPVDRLAAIYSPTEPNAVLAVDSLAAAAEPQGIRLERLPVPLDAEGQPMASALPDLVEEAARFGPQFLYLGPDSFLGEHAQAITDAANAARLPTFTSTERLLTGSDALYGLVAPYAEVGRLTAKKVDQILFEGADPGAVPVETLQRFSYQVRLDVARDLGVPPAMSLLTYAEIIGDN